MLHDPPAGTETPSQPLSDTVNAPSGSPWKESDETATGALVGLLTVMGVDCRPAPMIVGENSTPAGTKATDSIGIEEWNEVVPLPTDGRDPLPDDELDPDPLGGRYVGNVGGGTLGFDG